MARRGNGLQMIRNLVGGGGGGTGAGKGLNGSVYISYSDMFVRILYNLS